MLEPYQPNATSLRRISHSTREKLPSVAEMTRPNTLLPCEKNFPFVHRLRACDGLDGSGPEARLMGHEPGATHQQRILSDAQHRRRDHPKARRVPSVGERLDETYMLCNSVPSMDISPAMFR